MNFGRKINKARKHAQRHKVPFWEAVDRLHNALITDKILENAANRHGLNFSSINVGGKVTILISQEGLDFDIKNYTNSYNDFIESINKTLTEKTYRGGKCHYIAVDCIKSGKFDGMLTSEENTNILIPFHDHIEAIMKLLQYRQKI